MSKIEEMAERYATEGDEFSGLQVIEIEKDTYIAGANAALREIEKVLVDASEQYTSKQAVALNTEIYNKIRELKGE